MGMLDKLRGQGWSEEKLHTPATWKGLAAAVDILADRILKLEKAMSDVESKGIQYRGVHQRAEDYHRGDMVTRDGSIWHANVSTRTTPGESNDWTLACKKGKDAI